jgi:hypothetical protein
MEYSVFFKVVEGGDQVCLDGWLLACLRSADVVVRDGGDARGRTHYDRWLNLVLLGGDWLLGIGTASDHVEEGALRSLLLLHLLLVIKWLVRGNLARIDI